jgi:hypothetical protein
MSKPTTNKTAGLFCLSFEGAVYQASAAIFIHASSS